MVRKNKKIEGNNANNNIVILNIVIKLNVSYG